MISFLISTHFLFTIYYKNFFLNTPRGKYFVGQKVIGLFLEQNISWTECHATYLIVMKACGKNSYEPIPEEAILPSYGLTASWKYVRELIILILHSLSHYRFKASTNVRELLCVTARVSRGSKVHHYFWLPINTF